MSSVWPRVFLSIWIACELFSTVYLVFYHAWIGCRLLLWQILNMRELSLVACLFVDMDIVWAIIGRVFSILPWLVGWMSLLWQVLNVLELVLPRDFSWSFASYYYLDRIFRRSAMADPHMVLVCWQILAIYRNMW